MAARKRIVLVVKELAEALEAFLGSLPTQPVVQRVGSLLEFLEIPKSIPVDLLFLDADILEPGDLALLRRVLAGRPETKVAISFSQRGAEAAREVRALGALPLWKPYTLGELYYNIPQLLQAPGRTAEGTTATPGAELIGGLADELNNPLATISGHLQLLALDLGQAEGSEVAEKLSAIREGVERIATTVEQLILVGGGRKPRKTPIDLLSLLRERAKKVKPKLHKLELRVDTSKPVEGLGDARLLGAAFDSLLLFFSEAVPEGGDLYVGPLSEASGDRTGLLFRSPTGRLSGETVARLFHPYAPGVPGGLRLAAVRGIFRAHGGEVSAITPEDGILEVHLLLPTA